jgi:DNA-binding NtrC family response regulator
VVEDLGSANGTYVGGVRLAARASVPVAPGMMIEIGDTLLVLREARGDDRESIPPPPPRATELDPAMAHVYESVEKVASTSVAVLLLGETGAGKGVVAEAIHRRSQRAARPLVRVNCAALADSLIESELFGHERGAFTGALAAKEGLLEAADGGTLFLDEIGDMPLGAQAKLLHALEHGEVVRVGSVKPRKVDVRVLSATNHDLEALAASGGFRMDLLFRINAVTLRIPPLRERPKELASLARAFAAEASQRMGRPAPAITDRAMLLLLAHPWPGNVRELRNAMVRAALFAQQGTISEEHLGLPAHDGAPNEPRASGEPRVLRHEVRELEQRRIVEALDLCGHNQVRAAKELGISRGTLRTRMRELGLLPTRDKP